MTDKYKFDYTKLNVPSKYIDLAKYVDCVQFRPFFNILDKTHARENDDGICSIDIHNLPLLHYLTFYKSDDYEMLINGFCIHQGIGFTIIINDLAFHTYNKSQQLEILEKCKSILRVIYDKFISANDMKHAFLVITLIDIIHHTTRIITSFPYIVIDPHCTMYKITHNIMHWITLFLNIYYSFFLVDNDVNFLKYVHNPILLSSWLHINGCD
jgi:hypothetical protein